MTTCACNRCEPLEDWERIQVQVLMALTDRVPGAKEAAVAAGISLDASVYLNDPKRWRDLRDQLNNLKTTSKHGASTT